jgi:hypothetical protein
MNALGFGARRFPISAGCAREQVRIDDMFQPEIEGHVLPL